MCAGIGAWNYPIQIACWKAAPALAAGNAMVFKPSEADAAERAGAGRDPRPRPVCPAGAFNVVQGAGDVGAALVGHPAVAKVSVTGSVPTGERVALAAAERSEARDARARRQVTVDRVRRRRSRQRRVGGDARQLLLDRAGVLERHAVFVQRAVVDEFLARLVARTERIVLGDPLDEATQMGPLVSERQLRRVLDYMSMSARRRGRAASPAAGRPRCPLWRTACSCSRPCSSTSPTTMRIARRGDLRTCDVRARLRQRGRGGRPRQRHPVRAWRRGSSPATSSAPTV